MVGVCGDDDDGVVGVVRVVGVGFGVVGAGIVSIEVVDEDLVGVEPTDCVGVGETVASPTTGSAGALHES